MAHQYAKIAFTPNVRQVQTELGSRLGYAGMDEGPDYNHLLSEAEASFIAERDSFYMASVSESNWPYVQHRGGPAGFLKILDAQTLGFADYKGNRQYVSTGNFRANDKVSLILMDYANKRRLKILGRISLVDEQDWDTIASLEDAHYRARVERGFIIKISAFDWNCPQHITPRYNEQQLSALLDPLIEENEKLKAEINQKPTADIHGQAIGDGSLPLIISGIRQLTPDIRAYELRHSAGESLPKISPGAHLTVPIRLASGEMVSRRYSISSNPDRTDCYEIAVKKESTGNGGSLAVHQYYHLGLTLFCEPPSNHFVLESTPNPIVLIAAGIGITPIKSMALALLKKQHNFSVHYAGRSKQSMAYRDRLSRQLGDRLHLYIADSGKKLNLARLFENSAPNSHFYFCGPNSMLEELILLAGEYHIARENIHFERFAPAKQTGSKPVDVRLIKSGIAFHVPSDKSLLEGALEAGVDVPYSCMTGECKSCVVTVSQGELIDHQDDCLTDKERRSGKMCLCVSRPKSTSISIDL